MGVYIHVNHIRLDMSSAVPDPVFSIVGGTFYNQISLVLSCADPAASIYYTTDGSVPDESDTLYSDPIVINASTLVKAVAYATGKAPSNVISNLYSFKVYNPVITPATGTYGSERYVNITCATADAVIRYTTNGDDPTEESPIFTTQFLVTEGSGAVFPLVFPIVFGGTGTGITTVKAKAFKTGYTASSIVTNIITIIINYLFALGGDQLYDSSPTKITIPWG